MNIEELIESVELVSKPAVIIVRLECCPTSEQLRQIAMMFTPLRVAMPDTHVMVLPPAIDVETLSTEQLLGLGLCRISDSARLS